MVDGALILLPSLHQCSILTVFNNSSFFLNRCFQSTGKSIMEINQYQDILMIRAKSRILNKNAYKTRKLTIHLHSALSTRAEMTKTQSKCTFMYKKTLLWTVKTYSISLKITLQWSIWEVMEFCLDFACGYSVFPNLGYNNSSKYSKFIGSLLQYSCFIVS